MTDKRCFFNAERPCDLTCKAAFEVDDPVDNVDCHFVWLAYHFGEGMFNFSNMLNQWSGSPGGGFPPSGPTGTPPGAGPGGSPGAGPGPGKSPPGSPSNN